MSVVLSDTTVLSGDDRRATAASILAAQLPSGFITWFPGGHGDPWNHVEAAMALDTVGEHAAAEAAYRWLASVQRDDGVFAAYYGPDGTVEDPRVDTNATCYLAVGLLHHTRCCDDLALARRHQRLLEAAVSYTCSHQLADGSVAWAVAPDGTPSQRGLLAASSAVHLALSAACALSVALGRSPATAASAGWRMARDRLARAIATDEAAFLDKREFAMDWYYPVLSGVLTGEVAKARLSAGLTTFVVPGAGVLCRADERWVTTAETAECAIALARTGQPEEARLLLSTVEDKRGEDGAYLTGLVYPERSEFPKGEHTTYSSAAVLLAADVLAGGPTAAVFAPTGPTGP